MVFFAGFPIYGIENGMGMDVFFVYMDTDDRLVAGQMLCRELSGDLQRQFRDRTKFLTDSKRNNWKYALIQMHQELAVCIREILKLRSAGTQKVQRTVGKRDQLYPTLEELPPANLRRHVQFFTHDELVKLTNELNSLKEQSQLALIGSLLKKHEPEITDEADQLEIDINLLKPSTLRLIRDQVDQILHG